MLPTYNMNILIVTKLEKTSQTISEVFTFYRWVNCSGNLPLHT